MPMSNSLRLLLLLFPFMLLKAESLPKLITVYDPSCSACQALLEETYTQPAVKTYMEANLALTTEDAYSSAGQALVEQYDIRVFPTQLLLTDGKLTRAEGYRTPQEQLAFLNKKDAVFPTNSLVTFTEAFLKTKKKAQKPQHPFLTRRNLLLMCFSMSRARGKGKSSYLALLNETKELADKQGLLEFEEDEKLVKFISDYASQIKCKNRNFVKMREVSSIFKYAVDTADYNFIRDALIYKDPKTQEVICNPYIDFAQTEKIDGKDESLLDFIDKLLADRSNTMVHDFDSVIQVRDLLKLCTSKAQKK